MDENLAPYFTLGGGGFGAMSQLIAGQDSESFLKANAAIAGMQAQGELEAGSENAELYRQHLVQRMGVQGAQIGGANITTSGSALRDLESTAYLGAQDMARIQANAARKAWGFQVTEAGDLTRANMAGAAGENNAVGTAISASAKAWGQWNT